MPKGSDNMKNERVLAAINLFSVLRSIEDLVKMDEGAKELVKDINLSVGFDVPTLPKFSLLFSAGQVRAVSGKKLKTDINLKFLSPAHFNKMIDGEANPIPTRGLTKIKFLTNEFTQLTDILQSYLIPDEKLLNSDEIFREKSTILTAYVALFAAVQIGNYDDKLDELVHTMPEGVIRIAVKDGIAVSIAARSAKLRAAIGSSKNAIAFMDFANIDILGGILRGSIDTYACIGRGEVAVRGKIPMIDNFNKLLGSVANYL